MPHYRVVLYNKISKRREVYIAEAPDIFTLQDGLDLLSENNYEVLSAEIIKERSAKNDKATH